MGPISLSQWIGGGPWPCKGVMVEQFQLLNPELQALSQIDPVVLCIFLRIHTLHHDFYLTHIQVPCISFFSGKFTNESPHRNERVPANPLKPGSESATKVGGDAPTTWDWCVSIRIDCKGMIWVIWICWWFIISGLATMLGKRHFHVSECFPAFWCSWHVGFLAFSVPPFPQLLRFNLQLETETSTDSICASHMSHPEKIGQKLRALFGMEVCRNFHILRPLSKTKRRHPTTSEFHRMKPKSPSKSGIASNEEAELQPFLGLPEAPQNP